MRSSCTSSPSSAWRTCVDGAGGVAEQRAAPPPIRPATRRWRARAPARARTSASARARWRVAPRRAPPSRPPDCASAASPTSRPCPALAPSDTSPTSVCASSTTSPAILLIAPAVTPSAAATLAMRSRSACQGRSGSGSASSSARNAATAGPASPSAASVPTAPPNWSGSALVRSVVQRAHLAHREREPARRLEAERDRRAPAAAASGPAITVWRCRSASVAAPSATPCSSRTSSSSPSRIWSTIAVSIDVLARGAPVHIAARALRPRAP